MSLPNAEQSVVERSKVTDYLLCPTHEDGWGKAQFFMAFGFRSEAWEEFASALRAHCVTHAVKDVVESKHGTIYILEGALRTPDGRNPNVRSVWIIDKGTVVPRLISAYPLD